MSEIRIPITSDVSQATAKFNGFLDSVSAGIDRLNTKLQDLGVPIKKDVDIQVTGVQQAEKSINGMEKGLQNVGSSAQKVTDYFSKTPKEINKALAELRRTQSETVKFERGTRRVTQEWSRLTAEIRKASQAQRQMGSGGGGVMNGLMGGLTGAVTKANLASAALGTLGRTAWNAGRFMVEQGAKMELLKLQLEAFTGSAEGADAAYNSFKSTAKKTPFTLEEVARAGKIMMAFGVDTDKTTDSIERLALIAGVADGDLGNMARNLGQISSQGRAFTRDLHQFAMQSVPIWENLSIVTGKSVAEIKKLATEGKVGFKEVEAALALLTEKGGGFYEIGQRIKETWIGLAQALATEMQDFASNWVDIINSIDEGTGGLIKSGILDLVTAFELLNENLNIVKGTSEALGSMIPALFGQHALGPVLRLIGGVETLVNWYQKLVEWVHSIADGFREWLGIPKVTNETVEATRKLTEETGKTNQKLNEVKNNGNAYGEIAEGIRSATEASGQYKESIAGEKEAINGTTEAAAAHTEARVNGIDQIQEKVAGQHEAEQAFIGMTKEEAKMAYDERIQKIDDEIARVQERYDMELQQLQAMTPAQERLLEIRKEELTARANNAELSEKERVQAQAQLDTMNQQAERKKLIADRDQEIATLNEKKTTLEKAYLTAIGQTATAQKEANEDTETSHEQQKTNLTELKSKNEEITSAIKTQAGEQDIMKTNVENTTTAVNNQIQPVYDLAGAYSAAADEAERLARASASSKKSPVSNRSGNSNFTFAGGPVTGGYKTHINEFGQEAFLSASGQLSMINAKPWSIWTAPGRGTVIPAHLASQLNIPSGGVNVNKAAAAQTSRAASGGGWGAAARALKGAMGNGDRVTNNVTIQATNTTQAASDMMVQLNKIRRRRYR